MTSQGHPYARFRRALAIGDARIAEAAARDLHHVSLASALESLAGAQLRASIGRLLMKRYGENVVVGTMADGESARRSCRDLRPAS